MDDEEQLLTVAQVARRLGLNEETIRRWIKAGKLRAIRFGSNRAGYRIKRSDVNAIMTGGVPDPRQLDLPEVDDQKKAAA
jgi:excisionase family DNA binding protein